MKSNATLFLRSLRQMPDLKGPSQPHRCFCLHARVWLIYFIRSMSKRRKSLWDYLRWLNILSGTQPIVKNSDFPSPCNINNFDGIENGGGWLGSFKVMSILPSRLVFNDHKILPGDLNKVYPSIFCLFITMAEGACWKERKIVDVFQFILQAPFFDL